VHNARDTDTACHAIIVIVLIIAAMFGWRYATSGSMGGKQIGDPKAHQGAPK
jgi:hypothetical protein